MREHIAKEKMVLAVGCPPEGELPPVKEVKIFLHSYLLLLLGTINCKEKYD